MSVIKEDDGSDVQVGAGQRVDTSYGLVNSDQE